MLTIDAPTEDAAQQHPSQIPSSGPDLLHRSATLPTTGAQGARLLRKRFRFRANTHTSDLSRPRFASVVDEHDDANGSSSLTVDEVLNTVYPREDEFEESEDDLEYDSLSTYFQAHDDEKALVRREVERLIDVVKNPDTPLVLDGCQRLGRGDTIGYTALTVLAKVLLNARLICVIDNDGISLVHVPLGQTSETYRPLIYSLRRKCQQQGEPGFQFAHPGFESVWKTPEELRDDAVALMDFVSACVARYSTQIASGATWRHQQLGALAKFTAKVKFLLGDMANYAGVALRNAEMALATFEATYYSDKSNQQQGVDEEDRNTIFQRFTATLNADPAQADYLRGVEYRANQQRARVGFMEAVGYVLVSLLPGDRHPGFGVTEYEVCGVVMETGFEDFQTFLFQDRDFEYTSTSGGHQMNFAHPAYRMLNESIRHLKRTSKPPQHTRDDARGTKTTIEWMYSDLGDAHEMGSTGDRFANTSTDSMSKPTSRHTHILETMREIITVMAPLALVAPVVSSRYKAFLDMWYLTRDSDDAVRPFPERPFRAFVRLYTSDFEVARKQRLHDDVLRLADAVSTGLFSRTSLLNAGNTREDAERRNRRLAETHRLMDSWVYTEDAIVVNCGLYVWLVTAGAAVLVLGGLAIGLTVQDRIKAVDPFNITVYAWALAAFAVLICKAILVEEWSWSDFLHRRVRCRSVSELRAVTGINGQLITAKLLHDEQDSLLATRGPYNAVFLRKSTDGSGGFAIDEPIQNKTLLLSGLVMIKVETPLGHALVCLDVRRGTELSVVEHREVGTDTQRLICQDIGEPHHASSGNARKLPLKAGKLEWREVEGVYNFLDAEFI